MIESLVVALGSVVFVDRVYRVRTALSRENDKAPGPCVDQRAAMANAIHPDAIVSIHADGGTPWQQRLPCQHSAPPLNSAQAGPAVRFAQIMSDQLVGAGLQPSRSGLSGWWTTTQRSRSGLGSVP